MKFYSYDYVTGQISKVNWLFLVAFVLFLSLVLFFSFKYAHAKKDGKYRELVIIFALSAVTVALMGFGQYQTNQATDNQYRTSLHFIEVISKELKVQKSQVYVNTSAETDGAIVKVGDNFYRAIAGTDPDSYLLEKMDLKSPKVELVEANQ
ncbi:DUF3290 domain-containing protein [Streptococcus oricebi]|uniref:DUF3290 domain-containing protein n=1 Tax=Streptococcus oricebi TaxID=1547447 RepID=A0ABS5B3A9_9STRE|nr:hypothetical protein [Streptococcus oricebi]